MNRLANIYVGDRLAGVLIEDSEGYSFKYDGSYLEGADATAISLTLPLRKRVYSSNVLFPFFDGLIPEGWLLDIAWDSWKIDRRDRFSLLVACCKDCIGNVSVEEVNIEE